MIQVERTPNPNSLKFSSTAGTFSGNEIVALSSAAEADGHALGERLFAIDGVADVFITPEFVTVSKEAEADWEGLTDTIKTALTEYLEESETS
jgi:hypothetical protein